MPIRRNTLTGRSLATRMALVFPLLVIAASDFPEPASAQDLPAARILALPPLPNGDAVIRAPLGDSEIVVTTTSRLAGAIHSLTWNGQEFIDSADHGRQLQSASNLDFGSSISGETYNPTEAGSRNDGAGPRSSSRLLHLVARDNLLQTTSQMAFWLAPGQKSGDNLAKNTTILSDHLLTKRVRIGDRDLPNVLVYDVTFGLPVGEQHRQATFEVLTGYMPKEFEKFWAYDPDSNELRELSDGPGEQPLPVILATRDGRFAMGCYTADRAGTNWSGPGYGRFRFAAQNVVKWNCVFRYRDPRTIPAGDYAFRVYVAVGDLSMVRDSLARLHAKPTRTLPGRDH
jgi:hypothetical protein